jgi:hypothetical protein
MNKTRSTLLILVFLCLAFVITLEARVAFQKPTGGQTATGGRPQPTPEQLAIQKASEQDRQKMLDQLHITSLRPPVNARPIETGIMDGDLTFRQHSSGHTPAPNWPVFLTFAGREFKTPSP